MQSGAAGPPPHPLVGAVVVVLVEVGMVYFVARPPPRTAAAVVDAAADLAAVVDAGGVEEEQISLLTSVATELLGSPLATCLQIGSLVWPLREPMLVDLVFQRVAEVPFQVVHAALRY